MHGARTFIKTVVIFGWLCVFGFCVVCVCCVFGLREYFCLIVYSSLHGRVCMRGSTTLVLFDVAWLSPQNRSALKQTEPTHYGFQRTGMYVCFLFFSK